MIRTFSLLILALCFTQTALATTVEINDTRCVSATIGRVHASVIDYSNYSKVPGAKYEIGVPPFGSIPMLSMVKSQSRFQAQSATHTQAYVWVVLQPTNLTNAIYYPRFMLECSSQFESDSRFNFTCALNNRLNHYGLQDFRSTLQVTANAPECNAGETRLVYRLILESNSNDVDEIKREATRPAGPLAPLISRFFNEESFFRGYYQNYYESWARSL